MLGALGLATRNDVCLGEQESCFLEDKADSIQRLGEVRGENATLHLDKSGSAMILLLNASFQISWSAESCHLDDGFSVKWGTGGPGTDHSSVQLPKYQVITL